MSATELEPIPPRRVRWLVAVSFVSLVAAGWLLLTPGSRGGATVDADGYSRSAIGHRGLIALLRALGEPVVQQRANAAAPDCGVLVFAEPNPPAGLLELQHLGARIEMADEVLVVLPKRTGQADPEHRSWLGEDGLLDLAAVEARYKALGDIAGERHRLSIRRVAAATAWTGAGPAPDLPGPIQLVDAEACDEVLLACDEGVLIGRIGVLWVLADPDLIANHGLGRGDNAAIAVALLHRLRGAGGIVIDETLHGHSYAPTIFQEFGRFPLVLVPVHLLLVAALALWIANGRFGPVFAPPRAIGAGKRFLLDNTAALLRLGGRPGASLRRYGALHVRRAAERLHAPPGLSDAACREWLTARIREPQRAERLALLLDRSGDVGPRDAVQLARSLRKLVSEVSHVGG